MRLSQPTTPLPFLIIPDHNHTINLISPDPEFLVEPTWCPFQGVALTESGWWVISSSSLSGVFVSSPLLSGHCGYTPLLLSSSFPTPLPSTLPGPFSLIFFLLIIFILPTIHPMNSHSWGQRWAVHLYSECHCHLLSSFSPLLSSSSSPPSFVPPLLDGQSFLSLFHHSLLAWGFHFGLSPLHLTLESFWICLDPLFCFQACSARMASWILLNLKSMRAVTCKYICPMCLYSDRSADKSVMAWMMGGMSTLAEVRHPKALAISKMSRAGSWAQTL